MNTPARDQAAGGAHGESGLLAAVGGLVETLSSDYDLTELLQVLVERSVQVFAVDAAGLVLAGASGQLQVMAASGEPAGALELFQLQASEGPCLDCTASGVPVLVDDLTDLERWPTWRPAAVAAGVRAVSAIPMTANGHTYGALNLFAYTPGVLEGDRLAAARIVAQVASIVVVHERSRQHDETLIEQLQTALNTRVVIEQAKGLLAERGGITLDAAFELLRSSARNRGQRIAAVAQDLVAGRRTL